ncbi:MAG: hypothetical protein WC884_03345 [Candidatus Paceibacterota bacterium]
MELGIFTPDNLKQPQKPLDSKLGIKNDLKTSKERYEKVGETLSIIVKKILSLSVPQKTIEEWKILSPAIFTVDKKLDNITDPVKRLEFAKKIIDFLNGGVVDFSNDKELEKSMLSVKNLSANLGKNQREFFINSLSVFFKLTEKIKIEKDPLKLVELTRIEGQLAGRLYLLFLPQEFKLSNKYNQLVHAITRLGRAGNSFDSFIDLPDDYNNKQAQVSPTVLNRVLFLGAVLSDGLSTIKNMGLSKDLIKIFLGATKNIIQDAPRKLK